MIYFCRVGEDMICCKKVIVNLLFAFCIFSLQSEDVVAKRGEASKSARKSGSRDRKKSSKARLGNASNVGKETGNSEEQPVVAGSSETTSAVASESVTTTTPAATPATAIVNEPAVAETATVDLFNDEVKDMSKDPKWSKFRICMQQSCSGSDTQPNNVECYKSLNLENAFESCKVLVDEGSRENFKDYFAGPFLKAEKKAFCESEDIKGKFNDVNGRCALTVKYVRNEYKGKVQSCPREERSTTWYLDGKQYSCSGELLDVPECYKDSDNIEAAEAEKKMGYVAAIVGGVTATAGAITSISSPKYKNTGEKDKDGNSIKVAVDKGLSDKIGDGITGAINSGGNQIADGISQIIIAEQKMKEKGARMYGRCVLPNGDFVGEGSQKTLSW